MGEFKYKAFISYSHKDRKWTRWLHRRLETYPIPKNIVGNITPAGPIPKRLKPIFRDREELSASNNLGDKIEAALASSKNLIIICSPAAAKSKWVNQEILTFKSNNRDAQLFSVIVEGEPYASTMPGREAEECFPPALRFEVNEDGTLSDTPAEPLAADLRPHADGKRLGFLKLISGMIGVGLDDVVQRDMKRSRKRVTAITTGSLATVLAMGMLTGFALDARAEAQERRVAAEGLMDFMIGDLKEKLEPVGRLDVLDGVAFEALKYYQDQKTSKLDCDQRGRWARAMNLASEVAVTKGKLDDFKSFSNKAFTFTENSMLYCDSSTSSNYDHAQSAFWSGYSALLNNDQKLVRERFELYQKLIEKQLKFAPHNKLYRTELAAASVNLGAFYIGQSDYSQSLLEFKKAKSLYSVLSLEYPEDADVGRDYADTIGWEAKAYSQLGKLLLSRKSRLAEIAEANRVLILINPDDWQAQYIKFSALRALARLSYLEGDYGGSIFYGTDCESGFISLVKQDQLNNNWIRGLALCQLLLKEAFYQKDMTSDGDQVTERFERTVAILSKHSEVSESVLKKELDI